jgi:hypothetical protein
MLFYNQYSIRQVMISKVQCIDLIEKYCDLRNFTKGNIPERILNTNDLTFLFYFMSGRQNTSPELPNFARLSVLRISLFPAFLDISAPSAVGAESAVGIYR